MTPDLNNTIPAMLSRAARQWPERPALIDGELNSNYIELQTGARQMAAAFVAAGLKHGDRFAIWAPNIHEWVTSALGGLLVGAVLVPINTRFKGSEAAEILRRSKAKTLFTVSGFLDTDYPALVAEQCLPELQSIVMMRGAAESATPLDEFVLDGQRVDASELQSRLDAVSPTDLSDIIFTSGTTGAPKGVMTTHGQNIAAFDAWCEAVGLRETDRYLIVNPFFHSFGYKSGWLACILRGACALPHAVFDVDQILERIETDRISMLPGPPTVFQSLLRHPRLDQADISSLRVTITGAASIPVDLIRDMKQKLGFDAVFTGYGLTESSGVVSLCDSDDDFETIATTSGKPIAGIEVKVVDEQGEKVKAGEPGEILVRGYNVMQGYLDDPEATRSAIDHEAWLHTGDIGIQTASGHLKITDRIKDMFIVGGFNCYPAEIEQYLLHHPAIADVAVRGRADERLGEVCHAFAVAVHDATADEAEIIAWCRERMANYKVPRQVTFVAELPRNASGKVQKFKLDSLAQTGAP